MTVLSMIQDTADRLSITRPSAVVTSNDQQVRQLFALLVEECISLAGHADWEALTTEWTFVTVASEVQSNTPTPPDFDHALANTFFNRTAARELVGPITAQEWQYYKARGGFSQIYISYRKRSGQFVMTPAPPAGETIAYEYVSSYWAKSSANQPKATFTSDDDTTYLDEELVKLGLRWRWKAAKGLPYAEDMDTYERSKELSAGNDGGMTRLSIGGSLRGYPSGRANLPEGGFGI